MKWIKTRLGRFILVGASIFAAWFILYHLSINPAVLDKPFIHFQTLMSGKLLQLLGQPAESHSSDGAYLDLLTLPGASVKVGGECGAIELIVLFAGFIIAMGGPWKNMLWFLPLGFGAIIVLNILRIAVLTVLFAYAPEAGDFNHKYTFVIVVYAAIFALWVWWTKNYAGLKPAKQT